MQYDVKYWYVKNKQSNILASEWGTVYVGRSGEVTVRWYLTENWLKWRKEPLWKNADPTIISFGNLQIYWKNPNFWKQESWGSDPGHTSD